MDIAGQVLCGIRRGIRKGVFLEEEAFELGLRRWVRFGPEEMGDLIPGGGY